MIDQLTVATAVKFVRAMGQGLWGDIEWELQKGGAVMLLSVCIKNRKLFEIDDRLRLTMVQGLNKIIPITDQRHGPPWMIIFLYESEVIDSIYDWPVSPQKR